MPRKKGTGNTLRCKTKKKPAMSKPSLVDDIDKSKSKDSFEDLASIPSETKSMLQVKPPGSPESTDQETKSQEIQNREAFEYEVKRFIEVSKYFSSPLKKTASYMCEDCLISYPNQFFVEYKRGGITTFHIKFTNLKLEAVYLKLYKLTPHLEEIKYINLSLSRCKRIPPGLSFSLGFVYDDANEKPAEDAKLIFMASRKSTTPCYQVCEIDLKIQREMRKSIRN